MANPLTQRINQHQHLRELRSKLLHLHRVLLETERITYEQVHGRISSGELLQLVIHHEQFAWLHRVSGLIVQIDEMLQADEPVSSDDVQILLSDIRSLLTPDATGDTFASKYDAAMQREPNVVFAHAEVSRSLTARAQ